ncbi:unnamed protein product [Ectocarpus sp. 6 AP-2014]
MSSIFEAHDEEFLALTQDISNNISHLNTYETDAGKKRTQLTHIDALVGQAGDLLKQMEIEVRSTQDAASKKELQGKIASYKKTLQSLRGDYQRAVEKQEREGLLGGREAAFAQGGASQEQRDRLLQTTDRLDGQSRRLEDSKRTMMEIEDTAMEITTELGRNREKIGEVHDKVRDVSGMTTSARRLVHNMNRREVQQRCIMYGIGLVLVIGAIAAVYYTMKN